MLPLPIRVLRDAVIVMLFIVLGGWVGQAPYASDAADPLFVDAFRAVFGTIGFAVGGYLAPSKRPLQMTLTLLVIWLMAGLTIALGGGHAAGWFMVLVFLPIMAILGGGLALLVERLARE
ncbi:hypothetical protein [Halofilum ochraceum]|uniref:hypothetical protein n=1 Tax=Halofilum ochraceum TaxID=1611323 RepID=UPI0008323349|nr:hypothetical protein [Halofilum ochraceum]